MLNFLEIQNVAIIDKIHIDFGNGLNVLTGETGAGKSIIINSIRAILGERMPKDVIRTGEKSAKVTAVFYTTSSKVRELLQELDIPIEEDGNVIITREIYLAGGNVCRVNCKIVTMSVLRQIGEYIIKIHGQHDNKDLLEVRKHIGLLDLYAGERIAGVLDEYTTKLAELKSVKEKLAARIGDEEERAREIDLLKYQMTEISEANLILGEDEELEKKRVVVSNTEKIRMVLAEANDILGSDNGIRDALSNIANRMMQIASLDERYNKISESINNVVYQLDDVADDVRDGLEDLFFDEEEMERIDERLDMIVRLKRKYGNTIQDVLDYQKQCAVDLNDLENSEAYVKRSRKAIERLNGELHELAVRLNKIRVECAKELQERVTKQLEDLEMKDSHISVRVTMTSTMSDDGIYNYKSNGLDRVEFFIATNKGEREKSLARVASGGEMSRVMLAIKSIILDRDNLESIVFDEIDTGISGRAAQKVGEKLAMLGKVHQVICITHLPQIATMADNHYMIEKSSAEDVTKTRVRRLSEEDRTKEVARIIGGATISDITLNNAAYMISLADEWKKNDGYVQ